MAAKRILLLDGPLLTAYHWNAVRIENEGEFSHEPAGQEAFAAYLAQHRSSLYYVLADLAEEGFQLEDLPYVQGGDRAAMLQRRLGQYYYSTPLAAAIPLGRAKDGRRDEKLLFAALTRSETFTPWLETLREAEAILAGVYSVPLVLAEFAPQLLGGSDPVLVVSLTRGGVRQTFFDQGKLHFSRLSQLATRNLDEIGRASSSESAKIYQYLVAQRQIQRGVGLRTVVLAHASQIPALQDMCRNTSELQFEFLDLAVAARSLRLKDIPADSNSDKLFIHSLATKAPAQQFAPASERSFYRLWQIRSALTSAAWIVLAGCLLLAGDIGFDLHKLRDAIESTRAQAAVDNQRYARILAGLPKVSISPDNLRALIDRFEALKKSAPEIEPLLLHLSLALNDTPRIELTHLDWKVGDRPPARQNASDGAKRSGGPAPGGSAANRAVIEIQAQLPLGLANDQRAQIELIEGFATRLRDPRTEVRVLSRPFDIESDKPLKSSGEKSPTQLEAADMPKFSLRIARSM